MPPGTVYHFDPFILDTVKHGGARYAKVRSVQLVKVGALRTQENEPFHSFPASGPAASSV